MAQYLYGASVQGIQEFIFKTNQLQEIVGASEIVKSLEKEFEKISDYQENDSQILLNAAGNIKAIFENKSKLEKVVKEFPKKIMQNAYGITISQALVALKGDKPTQDEINELEKRLKIQRNKPSIPLDMHINILELYQKTARPIDAGSKDKLDVATQQKRGAYERWFKEQRKDDKEFEKSKELSYISNDNKHKIAIIHADGNGLGQLIPKLKEKTGLELKEFSQKLDIATKEAYKLASKDKTKIRPLILGGDDMSVVCDANIALEFTKDFLWHFEDQTQKLLNYKLTACAGIAYSNEKYPLHYALHLAEALTSESKKHAKKLLKHDEIAQSCLMFHNIQSSNFQSWDKFIKDELTITNDEKEIRCDFGPYYLNQEGQPSIEDFMNSVEAYRQDGSPISRLREWLGELSKSKQYSDNLLARINEMIKQNNKWKCAIMDNNLKKMHPKLCNEALIVSKDGHDKTPIYDVLQIISVTEAKQ